MEELRSHTEPHIRNVDLGNFRDGTVNLRKRNTSIVGHIAKHIIHVGSSSKPIEHIKRQAAIYLRNTTITIIRARIVIIGIDGIAQRKIIANRRIGIQSERHAYMLLPNRELHGEVFEISIASVARTGSILIAVPKAGSSQVEHKGSTVNHRIRSRLRGVDHARVTHAYPYTPKRAIRTRDIII